MKHRIYALSLCIVIVTQGTIAAQVNINEVSLLASILSNQVEELINLQKQIDLLRNSYKKFNTGFVEERIQGSLQILEDTMLKEVENLLILDDFLMYQDELSNIVDVVTKQEILENMSDKIYEFQDSQLEKNIADILAQQADMQTWLTKEIDQRDSLLQQLQLMNVNILEMNKQLSQLLSVNYANNQIHSAGAVLLEEEKKMIEEKVERFWGIR